jgi:hypothetical protein
MNQYKRMMTAGVSAILISLTLVGLTTYQAFAQGKAGKGAKARAGRNAKISKTPGSKQITLIDYEGSPVVTYGYKGKMTPTGAKIANTPGSAKRKTTSTSNLQNAENVRSQSERRRRR